MKNHPISVEGSLGDDLDQTPVAIKSNSDISHRIRPEPWKIRERVVPSAEHIFITEFRMAFFHARMNDHTQSENPLQILYYQNTRTTTDIFRAICIICMQQRTLSSIICSVFD